MIKIEIDEESIKEEVKKHMISRAVDIYFNANDMYNSSYEARDKIKKDRLDAVIGLADWTKLPEATQGHILKEFFSKFFGGNR